MKFIAYNEDEGRNEFGTHIEAESRKYSALQSLLSGRELEKEEVESLKEFKVVQQFLDSPIGDTSEAKLKKVFAAAIITANEQGTLPFSIEDKSPIAIASASDEGLNRVQLPYKLAKEEGRSRKQWMLAEMDRILEGRDEQEKAEIVSAISDAGENVNNETLKEEED